MREKAYTILVTTINVRLDLRAYLDILSLVLLFCRRKILCWVELELEWVELELE